MTRLQDTYGHSGFNNALISPPGGIQPDNKRHKQSNMLRKLLKTGIASGLHWTGVDRWHGIGKTANVTPLIVCYHRVVEDFQKSASHSLSAMLTTTKTLERHLDWIGKHYEFISLADLASSISRDEPFQKPVATITFDDGYRDVYENGLPLLNRKGIPSAIFVVTDRVGTHALHIHDELYLCITHALSKWKSPTVEMKHILAGYALEPVTVNYLVHNTNDPYVFTRLCLVYLHQVQIRTLIADITATLDFDTELLREFYSVNWDMLKDMSRRDVIIGSHTKSHPLLVNETNETILDETMGSRLEAEQKLGFPIEHFAYPDGRFNPEVVKTVETAGYRYAYTTCNHRYTRNPQLTIPRRVLWENSSLDAFNHFSPAIMSCLVNGVFDRFKGCSQNHNLV